MGILNKTWHYATIVVNYLFIGIKFIFSFQLPSQAHDENDLQNTNREKLFTIGEQPTTIVISNLGADRFGRIADFDSIKINGQDICNYYTGVKDFTNNQYPIQIETTRQPIQTTATTTNRPTTTNQAPRRTATTRRITTTTTTTPKPVEKECGIIYDDYDFGTRIAFSNNAEEGISPWHAAIFRHDQYICGGTMIKQNTILTAAHCLVDGGSAVKADALIVKLGLYTLDKDSSYTQSFNVTRVILNEIYNPDTFEDDIGILLLEREAVMNENVGMACLPSRNYNFVSMVGQIVGWGENEHSLIQNIMQKAYLSVIDRQTCLESNRDHFGKRLYRTNFCAGNNNRKKICIMYLLVIYWNEFFLF